MQALLRELIGLSVLTGALLQLCPEGGVKRVSQVLCTAVLSLAVLSHLGGTEREKLLPVSAGAAAASTGIEESGASVSRELSRRYLQEEYTEYITRQAEALGMDTLTVNLTVEQDAGGQWLPHAAELTGSFDLWQKEALTKALAEDLGIPTERQVWHEDGMEG